MTAAAAGDAEMVKVVADLRAECAALASLLSGRDAAAFHARTRFFSWSVYDEIAHLALFDELAVIAATDSAAFEKERSQLESTLASGLEVSEVARRRYAAHDGAMLLEFWQSRYKSLCDRLVSLGPKDRLPWFGPSMSARSFVTARLMETWAHGQDIYDAFGLRRESTPRLRHIAHLGVLTFNWSFTNRGMVAPGAMPFVRLDGGHGEIWQWGEESSPEWIKGAALDFCLVVTQRRHFRDTRLEVQGAVAQSWLVHAQCFAGPPATGPPAGTFPP